MWCAIARSYLREIKDMNSRLTKRIAATAVALSMLAGCTSCNLFPTEEEKYKLVVAKDNIMDSYAFSAVEYGDVSLTKVISCQYARLNEEKLSFEIGGRKVGNLYVQDGDDVEEGQLLASLDVSSLVEKNTSNAETIGENELLIKQQQELIDFYNARITKPSTSLKDRENYILARQQCEENIVAYQSRIDYCREQTEKNNEIISKANIYAPTKGTISNIKEDIMNWTAVAGTTVIVLIDTSVCAFTAMAKNMEGLISLGDSVVVETGAGTKYSATLTEMDSETGKLAFELDEPDYSLSVGLRGNVTLNLGERSNVMRVPAITVYGEEGDYYVYRISDSGVREMVPIEVGLMGNSHAEVLSGLSVGDAVILRNK